MKPISKSSIYRWFMLWCFLGPAFSLLWRPAYTLAPFALSLLAIFLIVKRPQVTSKSEKLIFVPFKNLAWGIWVFVLVSVSIDIYHGYHLSHFEAFIPFFLYPVILWIFKYINPKPDILWWGAVVGAWLGFIASLYQVIIMGVERANMHGGAISFGNAGVLLGAISAITWLYWPSRKRWQHHFLMLGGALAGVATSLLSGSKGGWLSILTIVVIFFMKVTHGWQIKQKVQAASLLAIFFIGAISLPGSPVLPRLEAAYQGFQHWKTTGMDADGSVGARLNIWKVGVSVAHESPWIGLGGAVLKKRFAEMAESGAIDPKWKNGTHLHNEMLNTYIMRGILGLMSTLAIYILAARIYWKSKNCSDPTIQGLSVAGLMTLFLYLEFGLTDVIFLVNPSRQIFLFWVLITAGLIYAKSRAWSTSGKVTSNPTT